MRNRSYKVTRLHANRHKAMYLLLGLLTATLFVTFALFQHAEAVDPLAITHTPRPMIDTTHPLPLDDASINLAATSLRWVPIGPAPIVPGRFGPFSGMVRAIAIDPTDPNTIYIGSDNGGVWKSTNGGQSWIPLTDNYGFPEIRSIAFDPSNHNTLYVGTNSTLFDPQIGLHGTILKSTDGGSTWRALTVKGFNYAYVVVPSPNVVYAAGFDSFRKSTDGGVNWSPSLTSGISIVSVTDLVADPQDSQTLYTVSKCKAYKTTNGADSWTQLTPSSFCVTKIAIAPSNSSIIYTVTGETESLPAEIHKSIDGGANWSTLPIPNGFSTQRNYALVFVQK